MICVGFLLVVSFSLGACAPNADDGGGCKVCWRQNLVVAVAFPKASVILLRSAGTRLFYNCPSGNYYDYKGFAMGARSQVCIREAGQPLVV